MQTVLLGEALSAAGIAPDQVPGASMRMRQVVEEKDAIICDLQGEIAMMSEGYNEMIATYYAKLDEYSFPRDDLGFCPVDVRVAMQEPLSDTDDMGDLDMGDMDDMMS